MLSTQAKQIWCLLYDYHYFLDRKSAGQTLLKTVNRYRPRILHSVHLYFMRLNTASYLDPGFLRLINLERDQQQKVSQAPQLGQKGFSPQLGLQ